MPFLRAMSGFRDQVRQLAMRGASAAEFLALSDKLRNEDMVELGVALDDQEGACPPQRLRNLGQATDKAD